MLCALFVALVAVLACAVTAEADVPPHNFFGTEARTVWDGPAGEQLAQLDRQQSIGVGMTRLVFDWMGIEREPNKYSLERYDRFIAELAKRRIEVMPLLFNPPPWRSARPPGNYTPGTYPPKDFNDMGDFGAVIARRYGSNGSFWTQHPGIPKLPIRNYQIWNEPHIPMFWLPRPDPAAYAGLLKATSPRIKAADPAAKIVTAGVSDSQNECCMAYRTFFSQMYEAGGKDGFDILAFHAYGETAAASVARLEDVRKIMDNYGDRDAEMWVTEVGWATGGLLSYRFNTTEAGQAAQLRELFTRLACIRGELNLRGVIWFDWRDNPPPDDWQHYTGLLRADASAKPSYYAYRDAVAAAGNCPIERLPTDFFGMSAPEFLRASGKSKRRMMRQQSVLGVRALRQVFDRRKRARKDLWRYDRLVSAAATNGLRVLPVLTDSSRGRPGKGRRARMASFAKALVRRYGSRGSLWRQRPSLPRLPIRSWQVWDAPNSRSGWGGRPNASSYAALLRAVRAQITRRSHGAEILAGSLSYKKGAVSPTRFIKRLYRANARRYFNVIAIAPSSRDTARLLRRARAIRRLMLRHRDRRGKLWITSLGWSDRGARSSLRVGKKGQAARVSRALRLLVRDRHQLGLRGVTYVAWRDRHLRKRSWVGNAGLLNRRGRPKLAYGAFAQSVRSFR